MMKNKLLVGFLMASATIIATAQPSSALVNIASRDTSAQSQEIQNRLSSEYANLLNTVSREEVEQKRVEIQQKIDARHAAVSDKLSGKRVELCKAKEAKINETLASRTAAAQEYLQKFAVVQERIRAFSAKQNLTVENAAALELILRDKRAQVEAVINVARSTKFDCSVVSAENPGRVVKDLIAQEKQTLTEYRTALKEYADAVKAAALARTSTEAVRPDSSEDSTENEGATQ